MADTLIREGIAFQSNPLSPVPQYWTGTAYEKVEGANGGHRVLIFDASGVALLTTSNPGKVDIQSALPAGTNNIGDVDIASALPAGTNNIGDIDVLTLPSLPAGTNIIGKFGIDQTTPGTTNAVDTELPAAAALSDATANPTTPIVGAAMEGFNGTTWDMVRNNTNVSLLASAARTETISTVAQTNYNSKGLHVVLDVTSAGTGNITLKIEGKDAESGKTYTLLEGASVTTNSTNVYKVYPGLTASVNAVANDILTRNWRVTVTHNNANSITYSVGAALI